ncbi:uncharacterized protein LOC134177075 [Corticium candelabrum]|uniref:uncharacterized protein LOC134177075 n=1 Tax=Corticium candelabrum TaxID=121492 RepID=UPI002E26A24E|nr:uncharacterized protein LOC134177075 [Corticium candelabrum]
MNVWTSFCALLVLVSTSYCLEHFECGSDHVLGSTPLTLYGLENKMTVWPIKMNGTTPKWRISPKKSTSFVRVIYSRLVIRSLSQTAGSHITYELWNGKKLIHSSAKARIEVGRAPDLHLNTSHYKVHSGHRLKICYTATGSPSPVISLHKKGSTNVVNTNPRYHIKESCLTINAVHIDDRGMYVLKANNCVSSVDTEFRLKVVEKPRVTILANASHIHVPVNSPLTLPYNFSGRPQASLQWFHNSSNIDHSKYTESNLHLNKVSFKDAGTYKVVVTNSVGKAQASIRLSVHSQLKTTLRTTQQYKNPTPRTVFIEQTNLPKEETLTQETIIYSATEISEHQTVNRSLANTFTNISNPHQSPSYQLTEQISDLTGHISDATETSRVSHETSSATDTSQALGVNDELLQDCNNSENKRSEICNEEKSLFSKWWFLAALCSAFVFMLLLIVILIICICKTKCCSNNSKKDIETEKESRNESNECNASAGENGKSETMSQFPINTNYYDVQESDDLDDDYDHIIPKSESMTMQQLQDDEPQYETIPADI